MAGAPREAVGAAAGQCSAGQRSHRKAVQAARAGAWPAGGAMADRAIDWTPALHHLRSVDGKLAAVIERHGSPTIAPTTDALRSLARSIVYQQTSGKAAERIAAPAGG